ncbi:MAG TPA: DeoR/GlpR transcriptional regulator [Firmicutes bacterium]|uniref:DeoR/GlpR transcriptional regulator n=1 Tax=Capillibacterium thermochitinicola TaxID=2699427 RepID=A0A8J6LJ00_9FIRM|nr:DeoR/GlpR family DNA-binding transcription regulator [Capillibacterium thermochitinicola]MBA2133535.1 DeoR/GlpR transcriptional regulator [Capillibacterium thermochitinicola]HHW13086.1 DeoR/GlpR transcriptional regulator [Bacillota bacterium]
MFPEERRKKILEILNEQGRCRVANLAKQLAVSEVTIRMDLDVLEKQGLLFRTHGGAILNPKTGYERAYQDEELSFPEEKRRIGWRASQLVSDGDTVILDVGTTVMEVARQLVRYKDLTVVTNALNVATWLENYAQITVIVTGGTLRATQHSLVNPYADLVLERVHADIAFIGANGIDVRYGVTNVNIPEAEMKNRFLKASRRQILVADSSKIGNVARAKVGDLDDFDLLITDDQADPEQVRLIQEAGLPVELV